MHTKQLTQQILAGFGEPVYLSQHLRVMDITDLTINKVLINMNSPIKFEFIPEQYLLNNTAYDMEDNIFFGSGYMITAAYTYFVDNHLKNKK